MSDIHIIGAGGHAQVVIALAEAVGHTIAGIYDDNRQIGSSILNYPVLGRLQDLPDSSSVTAFIAIGDNATRQKVSRRWQHLNWITLIHPTAWIAPNVILSEGSIVMAGGILQPSVCLGRHVIVNTMASVDHDSQLNDFVHIAPGCRVAGNVQLKEGVFGGIGSSYVPGITVGNWSIIGAGAAVTRSIPEGVTAVGVPAKIIKTQIFPLDSLT
jgi:acetyltransferase EpsM